MEENKNLEIESKMIALTFSEKVSFIFVHVPIEYDVESIADGFDYKYTQLLQIKKHFFNYL